MVVALSTPASLAASVTAAAKLEYGNNRNHHQQLYESEATGVSSRSLQTWRTHFRTVLCHVSQAMSELLGQGVTRIRLRVKGILVRVSCHFSSETLPLP